MADSINTINVGGIDKEVEDTVARSSGTSANERCTILESGLSNLSTRVDEIIAPTGEAPSAAEVADARIGADDTVYNTLGNAIRGQVNNITDVIDNIIEDIDITWTPGYYINKNGILASTTGSYSVTNFIPVIPGHKVKVRVYLGGPNSSIGIYDINKNVVSVVENITVNTLGTYIIDIPSNGYFIRSGSHNNHISKFKFTQSIAGGLTDLAYRVENDFLNYKNDVYNVIYSGKKVSDIEFELGTVLKTGRSDSTTRARTKQPYTYNPDYFIIAPTIFNGIIIVLYDENNVVIDALGSVWGETQRIVHHAGVNFIDMGLLADLNPSKFDLCIYKDNNELSEDDIQYINNLGLVRTKGSDVYNLNHNEDMLTSNLCSDYRDITFTQVYRTTIFPPLPPGTYTFSAKATSSDTDGDKCKIALFKNEYTSENTQFEGFLVRDRKASLTFTISDYVNSMNFYASTTGSLSEGDTCTFENLKIERGKQPTPYTPAYSHVDYVARSEESYLNVKDLEIVGNGSVKTYSISPLAKDRQTMTIFSDAKFTRQSGVTDYPRIRICLVTDRGFDRYSTWYRIGKEGEYECHEWRAPSYVWDSRFLFVEIFVPTGCTLLIRSLRNKYTDSIIRTTGGLQFFARPGTCNIAPEMSLPALEMAYRHGYNTHVVIPKISSDGQWFAYHDDTFDISSTPLRNPDGSNITDTTYNGSYFHEIPFTYLDQFDAGIRLGKTFAGTKLLKLEDFFEFCAKTGTAPRFSMHPAYGINTPEKLTSLKKLVNKYGLLDKLTILVNDFDSLFSVFGNDIAGYCLGNSTGANWDGSDGKTRIDAALTSAQTAKNNHDVTVPISCGYWSDGIFSDLTKAETLISDTLDAGFKAGVFSYDHTGIDGAIHSALWSEDIRWLASIGVTEFTDGYNTSNGLNW